MVALVADGRVYLKADAENLPEFEAAGSLPFAFRSKQRTITSSYWSVPGAALDSSRSLEPWITGALQAARRTARSEEHTSELQSLMRISYSVFFLKNTKTEAQIYTY